MTFSNSESAVCYAAENQERLVALIKQLTAIPAPSNHEEKRAAFIKEWLEARGAKNAFIDEALNVVLPLGTPEAGCDLLMAHTDTVFPDMDPIPVQVENGRICAPGVGDNTANAAELMLWAEYILENDLKTKNGGALIVFNSCEEGLGDLKGSKAIMKRYGLAVRRMISFDGGMDSIVNRAVGSMRWKITLRTEGGHSYARFGSPNAIARLSEIICDLYRQQVPRNNCRTTYNVGTIRGGTSVNTIAQEAEMLYEYRSDQKVSLDFMNASFRQIIDEYKAKGYDITTEIVGQRPCMGDVDPAALDSLCTWLSGLLERETGKKPVFISGSTDCNIPFSMGIPAACFGGYSGRGAHTRGEYIEIESLKTGMRCVGAAVLDSFT